MRHRTLNRSIEGGGGGDDDDDDRISDRFPENIMTHPSLCRTSRL